jgi:hypothetical protein
VEVREGRIAQEEIAELASLRGWAPASGTARGGAGEG